MKQHIRKWIVLVSLGLLNCGYAFSSELDIRPIGGDSLKINGLHKNLKYTVIRKNITKSVYVADEIYNAVYKLELKGKEYFCHVLGFRATDTKIAHGVMNCYKHLGDKKPVFASFYKYTHDKKMK
jgi:hypothetical protein